MEQENFNSYHNENILRNYNSCPFFVTDKFIKGYTDEKYIDRLAPYSVDIINNHKKVEYALEKYMIITEKKSTIMNQPINILIDENLDYHVAKITNNSFFNRKIYIPTGTIFDKIDENIFKLKSNFNIEKNILEENEYNENMYFINTKDELNTFFQFIKNCNNFFIIIDIIFKFRKQSILNYLDKNLLGLFNALYPYNILLKLNKIINNPKYDILKILPDKKIKSMYGISFNELIEDLISFLQYDERTTNIKQLISDKLKLKRNSKLINRNDSLLNKYLNKKINLQELITRIVKKYLTIYSESLFLIYNFKIKILFRELVLKINNNEKSKNYLLENGDDFRQYLPDEINFMIEKIVNLSDSIIDDSCKNSSSEVKLLIITIKDLQSCLLTQEIDISELNKKLTHYLNNPDN